MQKHKNAQTHTDHRNYKLLLLYIQKEQRGGGSDQVWKDENE